MKLAFTTSGNSLDANLDSRFGRASNFLVYDTSLENFDIFANTQNLEAAHGAGIQAAENFIKTGAKILITGNCGPKAYRLLNAANVEIFNSTAPTVKTALEQYLNGELNKISERAL